MKIGILGTGNMGGTLAGLWASAGHSVFLGSRDAEKGAAEAAAIGADVAGGSFADAAAFGEIIVLTVPGAAAVETVQALDLAGKTLIDLTNPIGAGIQINVQPDHALGQQVAAAAPGAKVVKALCNIHFRFLDGSQYAEGQKPVVPVCGDDPGAKQQVIHLVEELHLQPVDIGGLQEAFYLEAFALLWVRMARGAVGADFHFSMLRH